MDWNIIWKKADKKLYKSEQAITKCWVALLKEAKDYFKVHPEERILSQANLIYLANRLEANSYIREQFEQILDMLMIQERVLQLGKPKIQMGSK